MEQFSFMLKTYAGDVASAARQIDSFNRHNVNGLPLDVVAPSSDLHLFDRFQSPTITIISDESIPTTFVTQAVDGIRPGYLNQQLVKLAYGRLGRASSYMCLDSDGLFLNDFGLSDFISPQGTPYSVLVEDRALQSDAHYYREHWQSREKKLKKIAEFYGFSETDVLRTCHGFQIFDSRVLQQLTDQVLTPRGWDFIDLLKISPYEFSWYNYFLQKMDYPIQAREPYFTYVHTGWQYASELLMGYTEQDWARGYLGLVLNSNFQLTSEPQRYGENRVTSVAMYMSLGELFSIWRTSFAAFLIRLVALGPVMVRRGMRKLVQRQR